MVILQLITASLFLFTVSLAWASPLPKALAQALQKREQFYQNRRIVYRVEVTHYRSPQSLIPKSEDPKESSYYSKFYENIKGSYVQQLYNIELLRTPKAVRVTVLPVVEEGMRVLGKDEHGHMIVQQRDGISLVATESCYIDDSQLVSSKADFVGTIEDINKSFSRGMVANIRASEDDALYTGLAGIVSVSCHNIKPLYNAFRIGLNVSKLYNAEWTSIEAQADRWIMVGKVKRSALAPEQAAQLTGDPDATLLVELRKPDALILKLELVIPFVNRYTGKKREKVLTFRTEQTQQIGGMSLPSLIIEEVYLRGEEATPMREHRVVTRLEKFEPLRTAVKLELPKETSVTDERVGSPILHSWEGRLPSIEELKQMGYQQGRIVPPEPPRRRYSPILFLPAVLFFGGALYLYWRARRSS